MKSIVESPFSDCNARLMQEKSELVFRKEKFEYVSLFYECEDTKEHFTTTELDEINISQVYNQYRIKYGIPFTDEIREIRQTYGLPAIKMSEILGFGENQYRLYENGDMPSEANGKILSLIKNPAVFKGFVENAVNQFSPKDYNKIIDKLQHISNRQPNKQYESLIFDSYKRGVYNGYAPQSYHKLKSIILYFINCCDGVFNTKMNKLLFYTDFLSYKQQGQGITGLAYKAIQYGPVPVRWDRVYSLIDEVYPEIVMFPSGNTGTKLCSNTKPDMSIFSQEELEILETVYHQFKDMTAAEISEFSHKEIIWNEYYNTNQMIDYTAAFLLRDFD